MSSVSEAFTWAWVKAVVANGGSTSQMKGSIEVPKLGVTLSVESGGTLMK